MSRVGNKVINLPEGVNVNVEGSTVTVTGAKGTLTQTFSNLITVSVNEGFDVNTVIGKKMRGNVYKFGDVYTALNLSDLSFI